MPARPDKPSQFKVNQEVIVRADKRVGIVRNFWRGRTDAASFKNGVGGFKYLVEFADGKTEYFTTKFLKAKEGA